MFKTYHKLIFSDSRNMEDIEDNSIDLVVTSPPYPMIEMWDDLFCNLNPLIKDYLKIGDYLNAFESMHTILDKVWKELYRIMKNGSFACINVGDATRTINNKFQLFANHSRIQRKFTEIGFDVLPLILWRKQTNAPNKFMGSGMLPAGAYVTLEHEYILIFRKDNKRQFKTAEQKKHRMQSSFFWEERNVWFSDLWDFKGAKQNTNNNNLRKRSGAYPFVLPFRLINMYSLVGDVILDPFMGTGTTTVAAIASGRNSVGYELDNNFVKPIRESLQNDMAYLRKTNVDRIKNHIDFIKSYKERNKEFKYLNSYFGFPVMTSQERDLKIVFVENVEEYKINEFQASYFIDDFIKSIKPEELSLECFNSGDL